MTMTDAAAHTFRLDNEHLAFRYTSTVSHRAGEAPLERLTTPDRLRLWLAANDLDPGRDLAASDVVSATALREAIYRLGSATAAGECLPEADIALVNAAAANGQPTPELTQHGARWALGSSGAFAAALSVIARDAVALLGGASATRVKCCEGSDCAGLYIDTSRAGSRRWCSMNTCGNKNKKQRMLAKA